MNIFKKINRLTTSFEPSIQCNKTIQKLLGHSSPHQPLLVKYEGPKGVNYEKIRDETSSQHAPKKQRTNIKKPNIKQQRNTTQMSIYFTRLSFYGALKKRPRTSSTPMAENKTPTNQTKNETTEERRFIQRTFNSKVTHMT